MRVISAEQQRRYNLTARANRAARGECTIGCGAKLPEGHPWRMCEACKEKVRKSRASTRTCVRLSPAERFAIYQQYHDGKTARELAAELGKTVSSVRSLVQKVGVSLGDIDSKPLGMRHGTRTAPKDKYPRCRCGLLLPCWDCVTAVGAAGRRGPGYTYQGPP